MLDESIKMKFYFFITKLGKIYEKHLSKGFRKLRKAFAFTGASALIFGAGLSHAGDLTILHINDHHSHLKPDSRMSLNLGGKIYKSTLWWNASGCS
jgi:hypothetical protein